MEFLAFKGFWYLFDILENIFRYFREKQIAFPSETKEKTREKKFL